MNRIKLTVAYDGTKYSGWQIQPNAVTVEKILDEAIHKVTGENIHVIGASRTDAKVHAMGNVAVFDTESSIPGDRWSYALNRFLPEDVVIQESKQVSPDFHPRHCNTRKTYEYRILNSQFPIPQYKNYVWHVPYELNISMMKEASSVLTGEHDFKSFCCVRTQAENTVRTIYDIQISEKPVEGYENSYLTSNVKNAKLITIRITGNGFLYNMVRIITGTLVQVGRGQILYEDVEQMLDSKDRCSAGQTAPPQGLTLMGIQYVDNDDAEYN